MENNYSWWWLQVHGIILPTMHGFQEDKLALQDHNTAMFITMYQSRKGTMLLQGYHQSRPFGIHEGIFDRLVQYTKSALTYTQ
jgi:hypothetical protein